MFVVGSLAVLMRADLNIARAEFGAAVAIFWASSALTAIPLGRLAQRFSPRIVLPLTTTILAVSLGGLALVDNWVQIALLMAFGGAGAAGTQLSIARVLTTAVPWRHQGLAFGIKQAAVPLGTLVAGFAVALASTYIGWRWTAGALGLILAALVPAIWQWTRKTIKRTPREERRKLTSLSGLILLGTIGACGGFSGTSMATFLVDYLVEREVDPWAAGLALSLGSALTILVRVGLGHFADSGAISPRSLMALLMVAGGIFLASFGMPLPLGLLLAIIVVGYAMAWAWPGLLLYTVATRHPQDMAAASGVVQGSVWVGATLGPLVSGFVFSHWGFPIGWALLGLVLIGGSVIAVAGRHRIDTVKENTETGGSTS